MIFLARSLYSMRNIYALSTVRYPVEFNSISCIFRCKSDNKKPPEKPPAPGKGAKIDEKTKPAPKEVPKVPIKEATKGTTKEAAKETTKETPKVAKKEELSDLEKMRKLQTLFQQDNGLPVFLKGGVKDQLLYRGTLGLCLLGLILTIKFFVGMIFVK